MASRRRLKPPTTSHFLNYVSLDAAGVDEDAPFPLSVPAIRTMGRLELQPRVTFFVGENGTGKSTLLEGIADKLGFSLQGGSRTRNPSMDGYQTALASHLTISRTENRPFDGFFLRAESYYNHATELDELERTPHCGGVLQFYGGKSLHEQSHGEAFFATFLHRLGGQGIYLFDEPEAALSPQRQLAMLVRLSQLAADFSQFIIATHSPLLFSYPDALVYQFSEDGIQSVAPQDTEHFRITRNFLRDPQGMLRMLLSDSPEAESSD